MTGNEVREARRVLALTQAELAERLGVHALTVSRWERSASPVPEMAARLLAILTTGAPEQGGAGRRRRRG